MSRHRVTLAEGADREGFRQAARRLVAAGVHPDEAVFDTGAAPELFGAEETGEAPAIALPRAAAEVVDLVVCHRDPERYALLYRLVWRIVRGDRRLLEDASDGLVHRLSLMARTIRRDLHKMHAFVRFRRVADGGEERYVAFFEPDHFILALAAPFFVDRFRSLDFAILTPIGGLHWDRQHLQALPPARRSDAPAADDFEEGWRGYYESVFNPARVNTAAMRAEMPKKYWCNMPESAAITALVRQAAGRSRRMIEEEPTMSTRRTPMKALAAMKNQEPKSLADLNAAISRAGPLVPGATQAVFGEGPVGAALAFVGEQPGDQEDLQGRPFVGPAGQLLSRAMAEAGIDRQRAYLTNAVKHFKFELRGERRIHAKPTAGEVRHYRPWLMSELDLVHPKLVVALGATAVLALAGKALPIGRSRGPTQFGAFPGYITVHPSYLLRLPDEAAKREAWAAFVADLERIRAMAEDDGDGGGRRVAA